MAGTSYFNAGSRSGGGESPFYKLKPIPMTQKTNWGDGAFTTNAQLYVLRSGVTNNVFKIDEQAVCYLASVSSTGSATNINTVTYSSLLSGAASTCFHLNSADQCLYVLIRITNSFQLIKISDSSGLATALGSSFTPANPSRWPLSLQEGNATRYRATMEVDGSGHIRVYMEGYYHQINKTTWAIVSQDNVVSVGYSLNTTSYYRNTLGVATHSLQHNLTSQRDRTTLPRVVSSTSGVIADRVFPTSWLVSNGAVYEDNSHPILVDNDKVWLGNYLSTNSGSVSIGYVYRSDFDSFLQSIVDWYVGV